MNKGNGIHVIRDDPDQHRFRRALDENGKIIGRAWLTNQDHVPIGTRHEDLKQPQKRDGLEPGQSAQRDDPKPEDGPGKIGTMGPFDPFDLKTFGKP